MGLLGKGAVAIWHDVEEAGRANFQDWHGNEHMPERVAIDGFLRGRRYVAIEADLACFNLYEVRSRDVLTGEAYHQRLESPTAWTERSVRDFRSVARSLCDVLWSEGRGQGGLCATWRYDVDPLSHATHVDALAHSILRPLLKIGSDIAAAHVLCADTEASAVDTAERRLRDKANTIPRWILLVEGWGELDEFQTHCRALDEQAMRAAGAIGDLYRGIYRLQATAVSNS